MGFPQQPTQHQDMESFSRARLEDNGHSVLGSYFSWLEKHPSALCTFEGIMEKAEGKEIAVFLDYDGTLSQIVDNPDQAFMTDKMRCAVREVADCFPTSIVSGRCRDKVYEFVQLSNVCYAGSHGMDISIPLASSKSWDSGHQTRALDKKGDEIIWFRPAQDFLDTVQEIMRLLKERTTRIDSAVVEDNKFCVSVHYRRVNEKDVGKLKQIVESTMEAYPTYRITCGKKVMEIRPPVEWDKGRAMEYLLETLDLNGHCNVLPLYIGDDDTDEDAFKVIKRTKHGFSVIVSSAPRETMASYSLRDPNEVHSFLTHLAKWKRSASSS
ncbi:Trehalose 6-phosphate phosphatase [Psidium guajava]|nr:Trehalose 6-phosphate phosphatase [Psidium guajava]